MILLQLLSENNSGFWIYLLLVFFISSLVLYGIISSATRSKKIEILLRKQVGLLTAFAKKYDIEVLEAVDTEKFNMLGKSLDEIKQILGEPNSKSAFDSESTKYTWENDGKPVTFIFNLNNIALRQL